MVVDVGDGLDIDTGSDRWVAGGVVTGLFPGAVRIRSPRVDCVELRLTPVQAYALLGTVVSSATAPDALFGEAVRRLREQLVTATWEERFMLTEAFVMQRFSYRPAPEVVASWERILASHGRVRVGELAQMCGWSRKRLWSRFTAQIGVTPKRAAMLARFDRAVTALGAGVAAAEVAARCGYADQSHLHRETVLFAGRTPAELGGGGEHSFKTGVCPLPIVVGMDMKFVDEGRGPVILIVHGGMGDSSAWARVVRPLTHRYRVLRLHRRQYRLDLVRAEPVTITEEVGDVLTLARTVGEPVLLCGHSSGGVIALEAAAAAPALFAGLFVYEPPVVIDEPLGGPALRAARAAAAAGKPGKAIAIFERDVFEAGRVARTMFRIVVAAVPQLRAYVPRQLDDVAAIDSLGRRLDCYAAIELPTVLLGGDRSPAHLGERIDALCDVMPNARKIVMAGQAHNANDFAPRRLARLIEAFAAEIFS